MVEKNEQPNPDAPKSSWLSRAIKRFYPKSPPGILTLKPPPSTEPPLANPLEEERKAIEEAEARLEHEEELRSLRENIAEYLNAIAAGTPEKIGAAEEQYSFAEEHDSQALEKHVSARFYKERKDGSLVKDYSVALAQKDQREYRCLPRIVVNTAKGSPSSLFFYWHANANHHDWARDSTDVSPFPVLGLPEHHPLATLMSYTERIFEPNYDYPDSRRLYLSFELQLGNIVRGGKPGSIIFRSSRSAYDLTTFGSGWDGIKSKKHNFDARSDEFRLDKYYGGGRDYIHSLPYYQTLQVIDTLLSYIPTERVV